MPPPMYPHLWYKVQGHEPFINFFIKLSTPLTAQLFQTIGLLKFNITTNPLTVRSVQILFNYKPGCFFSKSS